MQRLIDATKIKYDRETLSCGDGTYTSYISVSKIDIESTPTVLTIPDNPTNGDMIKAMFPNEHIDLREVTVWVGNEKMSFTRKWWNAPWKRDKDGSIRD